MKNPLITLDAYITASGRYTERLKHKDLTNEVKINAQALLDKINPLLDELGIKDATVSSGFRPPEVNAGIGNAAKKSAHQSGEACDLIDDKKQSLVHKITKELLIKYNLYMEDPKFTIGANTNWCHLQTRKTKSGNRIFIP